MIRAVVGFVIVIAVIVGGVVVIAGAFWSLYGLVVILKLPDIPHGILAIGTVVVSVLIGGYYFRVALGLLDRLPALPRRRS